jgi:N-acetylglucosaminyldiphosphoundecaprenol N-acetyl-beta-D-mannosaminyltransferase
MIVFMGRRINVLGVEVSGVNLHTALSELAEALAKHRSAYGCSCPVYTLMQGSERQDVRAALHGADWVFPDGMPVVWALRLLGEHSVGRVYGPDLMLALSELSAQLRYPNYYVGGSPGVAEDLATALQKRFPGLVVAGTFSPPFRELTASEEDAMIADINQSGARLVWFGLGSPKQDLWMARCRGRLPNKVLLGVGAAFDFLSGRRIQAPKWMQGSGLEWAFRLAREPRRLWRRYVLYNPRFIYRLARQVAGLNSH